MCSWSVQRVQQRPVQCMPCLVKLDPPIAVNIAVLLFAELIR